MIEPLTRVCARYVAQDDRTRSVVFYSNTDRLFAVAKFGTGSDSDSEDVYARW